MFRFIGQLIKDELFTKYDEDFSGSGVFRVEEPSKTHYRWRYGYYTDSGSAPAPIPEGSWTKEHEDLLRQSFETAQSPAPA